MQQGGTYSGQQDKNAEDETQPRTIDTTDGLEGDLVKSVAVVLPCLAEPNVGQANRAPGEKRSETREGDEPVEDNLALGVQVDEAEQTADEDDSDGEGRAAGAIHVRENLGGVAELAEGSQGTRASVDAGYTDGHDRDDDDHVDEVIESIQPGVLADKHKWRGGHVGAVSAEETLVV